MNRDFNAGDNSSRSGKSRSPESEENKKNGKEDNEPSKLFAARNPLNQKNRPKRPRTTRLRPGETRPYDAAFNRKPSTEDRGDRPFHDRSNVSLSDRGHSGGYRDDIPRAGSGYSRQRPGGDRRNSSFGESRGNYNQSRPQRSDNSHKPYGKSNGPRREDNGFKGNRNRTPVDGNRSTGYGNRSQGDGNRYGDGNKTRDYRDKSGFRNDRPKSPFKKAYKPKKAKSEEAPLKREFNDAGEMRLNRYLAHAGICSRRQADDYIKAGLVTVNGTVVSEMGVKIKKGDDVRYNGERIATEKKIYILLNKPKGYVTTTDDEKGRKTVLDLVKDACPERVYPVGRLDINTTGVLLLTNDGDLTGKLTHPKYNKKKTYHVVLDKNLKKTDLKAITDGITLDDGLIQPDAVSWVSDDKKNEVGIEIHSGKNRIVRRIFEHLGYDIVRLDRVYFAGLTKKNLNRGKWRFLDDKEVSMLLMNSYV